MSKKRKVRKDPGGRPAGKKTRSRPTRDRAPAPGPLTVGDTLHELARLASAVAVPASVAVVLVELPLVAIMLAGDPTEGVAPLLWGLVAIIGDAAAIHVGLQHYRGEKRLRLGPAFKVAFLSYIGLIAAGLFSGLMILAFSLLLIVPGIIRLLGYSLIAPLIVSGESYGIDALRESLRRMKGYRLTALWAYIAAWIPSLAWQGLYAAIFGMDRALGSTGGEPLSTGDRVIEALLVGLYPVLVLPVTLLSVVLFHEIKRRHPRRSVRAGEAAEESPDGDG